MKIIKEKYTNLIIPTELKKYGKSEDFLFFDIETTGLNKVSTSLYLIGCGYYVDSYLNTIFFFAESTDEEYELITTFFDFIKNYKTIIHFNGTKFDLPYIEYKANKYGICNPLNELNSIDIYKEIKPLRYILFKESMRQKKIEDFMGIIRNDQYNGGELIPVYYDYMKNKSENNFNLLLMHNREDVIGMHKIIPILNYLELWRCELKFENSITNSYKDLNDDINNELIITYSININLPKDFSLFNQGIFYKFNSNEKRLIIRVPIKKCPMKHFYENYNDYFYLTEENIVIHKNMAGAVNKNLKKKATKDNCYTIVQGSFIPQYSNIFANNCGFDYKTRNDYFLLNDNFSNADAETYGNHLLQVLLSSKPKRHKQPAQ